MQEPFRFLKRVLERGTIENVSRSGRKKKRAMTDQSVKINRRQTMKDVTNRCRTRTGCVVSCKTAKMRLNQEGYNVVLFQRKQQFLK